MKLNPLCIAKTMSKVNVTFDFLCASLTQRCADYCHLSLHAEKSIKRTHTYFGVSVSKVKVLVPFFTELFVLLYNNFNGL